MEISETFAFILPAPADTGTESGLLTNHIRLRKGSYAGEEPSKYTAG